MQIQLLFYILEYTKQLLRATNDLTTRNQELETQLERERTEARSLRGQLQKQSDEIEALQKENKTAESEPRHLVAKVTDLKQSICLTGTTTFILHVATHYLWQ